MKQDLLLSNHLIEVAGCISNRNEDLKQDLWGILTRKFEYNDLEELINKTIYLDDFQWDYAYFYNMPNFNPRQYLKENIEHVDWAAISESITLNKSLRWDTSIYSYDVWLKDILKILKRHTSIPRIHL